MNEVPQEIDTINMPDPSNHSSKKFIVIGVVLTIIVASSIVFLRASQQQTYKSAAQEERTMRTQIEIQPTEETEEIKTDDQLVQDIENKLNEVDTHDTDVTNSLSDTPVDLSN